MLLTKLRLRQRLRWLRGLGRCAPCRPCLLPARCAGSSALGRRFAPPCRAREGGLGRCAPCRPPWARLAERGHPLRGQRCGPWGALLDCCASLRDAQRVASLRSGGPGRSPPTFLFPRLAALADAGKKGRLPPWLRPQKKEAATRYARSCGHFFSAPPLAAARPGLRPRLKSKTRRLVSLAAAALLIFAAPRFHPHKQTICKQIICRGPPACCALKNPRLRPAPALRLFASLMPGRLGLRDFFALARKSACVASNASV